jgi:hypothetical protein
MTVTACSDGIDALGQPWSATLHLSAEMEPLSQEFFMQAAILLADASECGVVADQILNLCRLQM